jgi:Peroxidase
MHISRAPARRTAAVSKRCGLTPLAAAGLTAALELLKEVTDKREGVSYADVFQLASATAIELAGGPKIPLRFGRRDARNEEDCCPEGRLPGGRPTLLRNCCAQCV